MWTDDLFICKEYCDIEDTDSTLINEIDKLLQEHSEDDYLYLKCLSEYRGVFNTADILTVKGKLCVNYQVKMDLYLPGYKMINL
jgi:hypothetical protein